MEILTWVLFGFVVGLIARALMPGRDSLGFVGTTVLGIFGALVGGWFARVMGWATPVGSSGLVSATLGAIVVLALYGYYQRRRGRAHAKPVTSSHDDRRGHDDHRGGKAA